MPYTSEYLAEVLRKTVEQLRADLASGGLEPPAVDATVEGSAFLFDIVKGDERRFWRYGIGEPVYAYVPDGEDAEAHGLWLATLIAEENITMLHRR